MQYRLLPLLFAVLVVACSSKSGDGGEAREDEILAEQIAETGAINAWDAVGAIKPDWLTTRSRTGAFRPLVYVEGQRQGDINELRNIQASRIAKIRYINPYEAERRWGADHSAGVFWITLLK